MFVTGPTPSFSAFCDFENGLCGYTQDEKSNKAHWVLNRGPTPTSYTGPKGDHTTGFGLLVFLLSKTTLVFAASSHTLLSNEAFNIMYF